MDAALFSSQLLMCVSLVRTLAFFFGSPIMSEMNEQEATEATSTSSSAQHHQWIRAQNLLRQKLVTDDDFPWKLLTDAAVDAGEENGEVLKYVAGVDTSFAEDDASLACAALVVLELRTLRVVYEDFSIVRLQVPYVPGFLAFREAPALLELLEKMKNNAKRIYPQLIMVDGNGLLHPQGFGLACHLGVMANLPAIGIGKNLHHVDGLTLFGVKQLFEAKDKFYEDVTLTGTSGQIWGVAMRPALNTTKPIFVSIGHRVSLETAVKVVRMTCKYRVPEPVRQADIRSRDFLRKNGYIC